MSDVVVTQNPQLNRYEAHLDGELAGIAGYEQTAAATTLTHTEVDSAFEGKGVGGALARFALDDIRDNGTGQVRPLCPFIKSWIDKHPDYADLVVTETG